MDCEYQDPDYAETTVHVKIESQTLSAEEKIEKIRATIRREFSNELDVRENEVMLLDQRMAIARRLLHRLRYTIVCSYYGDQKLQLTPGQMQDEVASQHEPRARAEASALLRDGQRRLHPSVRKLLGKKTADLDEILKRGPRNKIRKDYSAMIQTRTYTLAATKTNANEIKCEQQTDKDATTSGVKKVPRHLEPKIENVLTLDEVTRNKTKYRYRIIIGNTSKYAPPASRADRSTHKWLLYVRGPVEQPDISRVVTAVTVRLHHSYAPHHTVHIDKPPYHVSRRGWGEFPAQVELHFALPDRNRPASVEHTVKLDRHYTGLQTLGAETVVDVWLYSTQEMLQYEFKEQDNNQIDVPTPQSAEPEPTVEPKLEPVTEENDSWLNFFSNETTELDVDQMIIKPVKTEPNTDLGEAIDNNVVSKEIAQEENAMDLEGDKYEMPAVKNDVEWPVDEDIQFPVEILNQPTLIKKRIMKYMDPSTGKVYYLEMDRALDLSKVQEIVINSKGNVRTAKISPIKSNGLKSFRRYPKKAVSLLKPEVKNLQKVESKAAEIDSQKSIPTDYKHIENDHCYLGDSWSRCVNFAPNSTDADLSAESAIDNASDTDIVANTEDTYDCLCATILRLSCVRMAVNYLLKKMPVISHRASDPEFLKHFPFVVEDESLYWRLDFAKRRNIEWSRAKLINRMLTEHYTHGERVWRTKQILLFSRLHGYYPVRQEVRAQVATQTEDWSSWIDLENSRKSESNIKEIYPSAADVNTLTVFDPEEYISRSSLSEAVESTEPDEDIDVVGCHTPASVQREEPPNIGGLEVLPVVSEEDRLSFLFIESKCADIGVELRNEDVGSGYSYSAVHAVMLSAVRCFAEELIRGALAAKLMENRRPNTLSPVWVGSSSRTAVCLEHVYAATRGRLAVLTGRDTAAEKKQTTAL